MALYSKFERLLALRPDVAVIQECASPARDAARSWQAPCTDRTWIGANPDKGLGVFTFGGLHVRRDRAYSGAFSLYLPVRIEGGCRFNLLAVWTADARRLAPEVTPEPAAALRHYRQFLSAAPAVVAGDFNRLPQQMAFRAGPAGRSVLDWLARLGLQNADEINAGRTAGHELRRTHYHQRRPGRGFVVDYLFVPRREAPRLTAFEVGSAREWIPWSDHVPLVAECAVTRKSGFIPHDQEEK